MATAALTAAGCALVHNRGALAAHASRWLLLGRERQAPSPCPYSLSPLLELPRPWLTVHRLIEILAPKPGEKLLELGVGTGLYALPVARAIEPEGTLDAFDVQQPMLDALMRRAGKRGISNIRPEQGDAQRLPYNDDTFDAAYLVTVLHEVPDQDTALHEIRRVLKPGGRLVIGEISPLPTPHFVRLPTLIRRAEAAGFRFERRLGPALAFYARFSAHS